MNPFGNNSYGIRLERIVDAIVDELTEERVNCHFSNAEGPSPVR